MSSFILDANQFTWLDLGVWVPDAFSFEVKNKKTKVDFCIQFSEHPLSL